MSEASDRLEQALATLAKDAADLWLAHADLHAGAKVGCGCGGTGTTTGSEGEAGHHVAAHTGCTPAHVGPGQVRVAIPPKAGGQLAPVQVIALPAGVVSTEQYQAAATQVSAAVPEVVVSIPPTLPPRPYIGRIRDASGQVSSAFVIYVDGL